MFYVFLIKDQHQMYVHISENGVDWNEIKTEIFINRIYGGEVYYFNNQFVVLSSDPDYFLIYTTTDFVTWTEIKPDHYIGSLTLDGMKVFSPYFIINPTSDVVQCGHYLTSNNLIEWSEVALADSNWCFRNIYFENGKYFATGYLKSEYNNINFMSDDGNEWFIVGSLNDIQINDFSYDGGEMTLVGSSGAIYTSRDVKTWANKSILFGPHFMILKKIRNEYIALTASSTNAAQIWSSKDMFFWDIFEVISPVTLWSSIFDDRNGAITSVTDNDKTILVTGYNCGGNYHGCIGYIVTSQ
jgi:hypothetical protein